ncbi:MAG: pyridoxamine 5'-phosphate oxidase family protein [Alistipes sp.]|nr:pyridoxamine 5'-phosphate oxidase family protein [Alistipes sp.]
MTLQEVERLIDSRATAFVASVDEAGFPNMKAMLAPRLREGLRTFYFTTNTHSMRVAQYRRDPKASVYFCDEAGFRGVMLRGTMETLTDAASRRLIWREGDTEYYPQGVDDPDYCVLRFTACDGRTYTDYHSENFVIEK